MALAIICNARIDDVTAQQALPCVGGAGRTARIFKRGRDHKPLTANALHTLIPSGGDPRKAGYLFYRTSFARMQRPKE